MRLLAEDRKQFLLPLASLVSLEEAGIPGGTFAMRSINPTHVEDLVHSEVAEWPPIKVTKADVGYLLIDGYHRKQAAARRQVTALLADCTTYRDEQDVIEAVFRANLTHGLKASRETRGDYAYWLHLTYPDMRQEEIAARVGVTQSVVSKAIARREAALCEEERPEEKMKLVSRTCRSFTRMAVKFLSAIEETTDYETLVQTLNTVMKTDADREKLARLGQLLCDSAYPLHESQAKATH